MVIASDLATAQFGAILKTSLDAVVVMRPDGTIAGWNDVAAATFGWSFAEVDGKRMSELIIPPQYRAAHETGLAHFLATGEGPVLDKHLEISALHRDGREIPVELSITHTRELGEAVFLGFLRDISERKDLQRRQDLLVGELNHRVKNLLGVVGAIAHQTMRTSPTLSHFGPAFMGRLESLGRAHELLTAATWERASLGSLVGAVLESFVGPSLRDSGPRATVSGPELMLSPRQFLSLSMILHELTTNAVKYGALAGDGGTLDLAWRVTGNTVALDWREHAAHAVTAPTGEGFGSKMIALNVRHDLRGTAVHQWHPDGLEFRLTFDHD